MVCQLSSISSVYALSGITRACRTGPYLLHSFMALSVIIDLGIRGPRRRIMLLSACTSHSPSAHHASLLPIFHSYLDQLISAYRCLLAFSYTSTHSSCRINRLYAPFSRSLKHHILTNSYLVQSSVRGLRCHSSQNVNSCLAHQKALPSIIKTFCTEPISEMCLRVIEKYAVCGCIYHVHGVDACAAYGQHGVSDKVVQVGYACPTHMK